MNAILLLLGLLVLSYVGSMLRGERAIAGLGLPSGAEYLCLGFVLGGHALGIINQSLLDSFEPLLVVGASWIAFLAGLGYTQVGERRVAAGRALLGISSATLVGGAVFSAVFYALPPFAPESSQDRLLLALGVAIVSCGSTRQAVRWVVQRYATSGPLADTLADYARASAIVPVVGLALLLSLFPGPGLSHVTFGARVGLTFGIGALLGLVALLLVSRGLSRDEVWGILVGTSLLSIGVAARLGLSAVAAAFSMGLTLGTLSPRRAELSAMLRPTERGVLLPLAVLAGALVNLRDAPLVAWLVPCALLTRYAAELVRSLLLYAVSRPARSAGPLVAFGLVSTGDVTLACAVSIAVAFERPAALSVLAVAAAGLLLGELIGPIALRRSLGRAGELHRDSMPPRPEPPLSVPPLSEPPAESVGSAK